MTAPLRRAPSPLGTPLTFSLVVVLVLATFGVFATGFGALQTCTDLYGDTATGGDPCAAAESWVNRGWAVQGVLLIVGLVLAVLTRRGIRSRTVRWAGRLLGPVSIALLITTTSLANASY
ncbi:MAG: hypothetical protein JHC71_15620 [Blastococcus sp.]|nr:hypothetical protein [Blastococcus sp.]